jgi:hypothetical protein
LTTLKMAVFAPMPIASETTITSDSAVDRRIVRIA